MEMIDHETLQEQAKWAEYKSTHPSLKSKIVEGLPIRKDNETFYGIRFFFEKGKRYAEVLYLENPISCIEDNTPHTESTILFKDLETK